MKIKQIIELVWKQKALGLFFIISFLLWHVIKLSETYTTNLTIPVKLISDGENNKWIENPDIDIVVNCQSDGSTIASYKINAGQTIQIPISKLNLNKVSEYGYTIDNESLLRVMQSLTNNININFLADTTIFIHLSKSGTKKVPVIVNTDITYAPQHMNPDGKIIFGFDSVELKAPKIILDTIEHVSAKTITHKEINHSIKNSVPLIIPKNVLCKQQRLPYEINVERCTQYKFTVDISILNYYHNDVTIIPKQVTIFLNMPLSAKKKESDIKAYIEYSMKRQHPQYEVKLTGLPEGSEIVAIEPRYVEAFRMME